MFLQFVVWFFYLIIQSSIHSIFMCFFLHPLIHLFICPLFHLLMYLLRWHTYFSLTYLYTTYHNVRSIRMFLWTTIWVPPLTSDRVQVPPPNTKKTVQRHGNLKYTNTQSYILQNNPPLKNNYINDPGIKLRTSWSESNDITSESSG